MQTGTSVAGDVRIEHPRPGDLGRIVAEHGRFYVGERGYPPVFETHVLETVGAMAATLKPPADRFFIARLGEAMVGSAAVRFPEPGVAQLRFVLIDGAVRGAGLGRRLVDAAIAHARVHGAREMVLETASDLAAARHIYESAGFRMERHYPAPFLPDGVVAQWWRLALSGAGGPDAPA